MAQEKRIRKLNPNKRAQEELRSLLDNIEVLNKIVEEIEKTRGETGNSNAFELISTKLNIEEKNVDNVYVALKNLKSAQERYNLNNREIIEAINSGILSDSSEEWKSNYLNLWNKNKKKISKILDGMRDDHPIALDTKTSLLTYARQNTLVNVTILTDIRPVFDSKAENVLKGIVTHNLAIEYHDGTENRRIHFALDNADLRELRRQSERGEKKSVALKRFAADKSWKLQVVEDDDEKSPN